MEGRTGMDLVKQTEEIRTRPRLTGERKTTMTALTWLFSLSRVAAVACTCAALASGADFAIGIGSAVAGNSIQAKGAVMVARPEGCAEPAKARIEGAAA